MIRPGPSLDELFFAVRVVNFALPRRIVPIKQVDWPIAETSSKRLENRGNRQIAQFVDNSLAAFLGVEDFHFADKQHHLAALGHCFLDQFSGRASGHVIAGAEVKLSL